MPTNDSATKLSGSFATVSVGATPTLVFVKSWDSTIEAKAAIVSATSQSPGFDMKAPLNQSATFAIEVEYDSAQPLTTSGALGFAPGSYVSNLTCSVSAGSAAPSVVCPSALVTKVAVKSVVDTIITVTVDLESNGSFTYTI